MEKKARSLLIITELWAYVSGRVKKPIPIESPTDSNVIIHHDPALVATWEAKDEVSLEFIHMTIDIVVDQNIVNVVSFKDAWNTLLDSYER